MSDFKCPRDTDGDGDCAACARRHGGCFEKPKTDVIVRLRKAWEKTPNGEWEAYDDEVLDSAESMLANCCSAYRSTEVDMAIADFIALAHNEFGKILAVLEAAQALETAVIDHRAYRFSGPPDAHEKVADQIHLDARRESERLLIAALSALKGDHS